MTDEHLSRLLTDQLPPIPPEYANPPRPGALLARARTRRRVLIATPAAAALVAATIGTGTLLGATAAPAPVTLDQGAVTHTLGPSPQPGSVRRLRPVDKAQVSRDGRTLDIAYQYGGCESVTLTYGEDSQRVALQLEYWTPADSSMQCPMILWMKSFTVRLAAPLGARHVIDLDAGTPVPVSYTGPARHPGYLPPGCTIAKDPVANEISTSGGAYKVVITQWGRTEAAPYSEDVATRLRTTTVQGQPATVVRMTEPGKIDPATGKPYIDSATGKPYVLRRHIEVSWLEGDWRIRVWIAPQEGLTYQEADLVHQALAIAAALH
jgi:hypothetical protein